MACPEVRNFIHFISKILIIWFVIHVKGNVFDFKLEWSTNSVHERYRYSHNPTLQWNSRLLVLYTSFATKEELGPRYLYILPVRTSPSIHRIVPSIRPQNIKVSLYLNIKQVLSAITPNVHGKVTEGIPVLHQHLSSK